jgi:hypothetical protein
MMRLSLAFSPREAPNLLLPREKAREAEGNREFPLAKSLVGVCVFQNSSATKSGPYLQMIERMTAVLHVGSSRA